MLPTLVAASSNVADYDLLVSTAATNGGLTYNCSSVSWRAKDSTPIVYASNAIHLLTTSKAVVIQIDGGKLANNARDYWDGSLLVPIQIDETGLLLTRRRDFIGTNVNGFSLAGQALGNPPGTLARGDADVEDSSWVNCGTQNSTLL